MIWKLAWRNLWRHRGRSLIMISAVGLAYALALVALGINDDAHARMLEEAATAAGGDLLIHGEGYWATRASDIVIADGDEVLDRVRGVDGVRAAIPRIIVTGLVSTSSDSRPVYLQGIRPELESALTDYADDLVAGTFLEGEERAPLVLGSRLAERLELELGDRVVLTASGPDGEMTRSLFHLTGTIEAGTRELDEMIGLTTLDAAARAMGMDGMLSQVGVLTGAGADVDSVAARIRATLAAPPRDSDLEVLTWAEAVPEMVGFIAIDDAFGYIYLAIIFAVVLFSIANTFLMAVMERVREMGLLNALGLRHGRLGRLLLAETVLLIVLAMSLGFLMGYGGHLAIDHWGVSTASAYGLEDLELSGIDVADMVIYSRINPAKWIAASVLVALATLLSALYPAWRATRLAPAEAMRFYE